MCFDSETELWLVEGSDDVITGTCQKWVITFTGAAERHEHQSEQELVLLFTQGHATTLCTSYSVLRRSHFHYFKVGVDSASHVQRSELQKTGRYMLRSHENKAALYNSC